MIEQIESSSWESAPRATEALESGKIVMLPSLRFELSSAEQRFLSTSYLSGDSKNISYRPETGALGGAQGIDADRAGLAAMLRRFYESARSLARAMMPSYGDALTPGFTSFRPAEIAGRTTSWRKDDTRLHVDAFPSRPLRGRRILRVFANVNPRAPRVWRAGEPFEDIAARFLPKIRPALPGSASLLYWLRVTKAPRTDYDHLMLGIHDGMKADEAYQRESPQLQFEIAPGTTWLCYTDSVSHAAMSGQFAMEQTFYLPVEAMSDPAKSPLRVLERLCCRKLV